MKKIMLLALLVCLMIGVDQARADSAYWSPNGCSWDDQGIETCNGGWVSVSDPMPWSMYNSGDDYAAAFAAYAVGMTIVYDIEVHHQPANPSGIYYGGDVWSVSIQGNVPLVGCVAIDCIYVPLYGVLKCTATTNASCEM